MGNKSSKNEETSSDEPEEPEKEEKEPEKEEKEPEKEEKEPEKEEKEPEKQEKEPEKEEKEPEKEKKEPEKEEKEPEKEKKEEEKSKFGENQIINKTNPTPFIVIAIVMVILGISAAFLYKFFTADDYDSEEEEEEEEEEEPLLIKWSRYSDCGNKSGLNFTEWHYLDRCYVEDDGSSKIISVDDDNLVITTKYTSSDCSGDGSKEDMEIVGGDGCTGMGLNMEAVLPESELDSYDIVTRHWENSTVLGTSFAPSAELEARTDPVFKTYDFNQCYRKGNQSSYMYTDCTDSHSSSKINYSSLDCSGGSTGSVNESGEYYYDSNNTWWHSMECNENEGFKDMKNRKIPIKDII